MNRWALQRYTDAEVWLRTQADRATTRLKSRADSGQTSFEYLGIAVVIAVIIGVLATTGIGDAVQTAILDAISKISGGNGK
ncbi:Flp family type IVb pilin [Streptomyces sp. NPDC049040]|uniref:Flp family type IVb pilin n=1 Tax=Streptomyces sp. NPDC049040 TaxID=3365593 RepID=UPI00371BD3D9